MDTKTVPSPVLFQTTRLQRVDALLVQTYGSPLSCIIHEMMLGHVHVCFYALCYSGVVGHCVADSKCSLCSKLCRHYIRLCSCVLYCTTAIFCFCIQIPKQLGLPCARTASDMSSTFKQFQQFMDKDVHI